MNTKDMDKMIGRRLRQERDRRGLTLEELAELCSISVSYLGYVERGQRPASLTILKKLSLALRVPLSGFLEDASKERRSNEEPWGLLLKLLPLLQRHEPQAQQRIVLYWKQNLEDIQKFFQAPRIKKFSSK